MDPAEELGIVTRGRWRQTELAPGLGPVSVDEIVRLELIERGSNAVGYDHTRHGNRGEIADHHRRLAMGTRRLDGAVCGNRGDHRGLAVERGLLGQKLRRAVLVNGLRRDAGLPAGLEDELLRLDDQLLQLSIRSRRAPAPPGGASERASGRPRNPRRADDLPRGANRGSASAGGGSRSDRAGRFADRRRP